MKVVSSTLIVHKPMTFLGCVANFSIPEKFATQPAWPNTPRRTRMAWENTKNES